MKLRRSRENVLISGVLGGLGEYFTIDPTILRIGFVLFVFLNVSVLIPLYIIGAIIIPKEDPKPNRDKNKIDKSPIDEHNMGTNTKINDDDWSDF